MLLELAILFCSSTEKLSYYKVLYLGQAPYSLIATAVLGNWAAYKQNWINHPQYTAAFITQLAGLAAIVLSTIVAAVMLSKLPVCLNPTTLCLIISNVLESCASYIENACLTAKVKASSTLM